MEERSTYSISRHGHGRREEEDDRDKRRPTARVHVDEPAGRTKGPRAWLELVEDQLAQNGDTVRPVERDGTQIEDGRDRNVAAQADEVDQDADQSIQPHSEHGRVSLAPDLVPDPAAGQHLVAGKGPDGAGAGLESGDAHKVHDDEGGHGEEDGGALAHHVVVNLHHGLLDRASEDVPGWVVGGQVKRAHAEGQDNVEQPAHDVGEAQRSRDGSRHCHSRVLGLFSNVSGSIVIGHRPGHGQEAEQEAESWRRPARVGLNLGENVACRVLVLLHHEECDTACEQHDNVDHCIGPRDLGQPCRVEAVDAGVHDGQASHDANDVSLRWRVREVGADGHGSEQHLRRSVGGGCAAADLADQIQPACHGDTVSQDKLAGEAPAVFFFFLFFFFGQELKEVRQRRRIPGDWRSRGPAKEIGPARC